MPTLTQRERFPTMGLANPSAKATTAKGMKIEPKSDQATIPHMEHVIASWQEIKTKPLMCLICRCVTTQVGITKGKEKKNDGSQHQKIFDSWTTPNVRIGDNIAQTTVQMTRPYKSTTNE